LRSFRRYSEKEKTPQRSSGHSSGSKNPQPALQKGPSPDKSLKKEVHYEKSSAAHKKNKKAATPPKTGKPPLEGHTIVPLGQNQNQAVSTVAAAVVSPRRRLGKAELFEFFCQNNLAFRNIDHPEVFTVEAMLPHLEGVVEGAICKNLFLVEKRRGSGGRFFLLAAEHTRTVRLADVAQLVGAKELRFASEEALYATLGVRQGCVTALGLVNDPDPRAVSAIVVDAALLDESRWTAVNFHPLVNTATTTLSTADFRKFLALTGHTVIQF
jgi:Ala-tRNA(Pro) deacylase